MSSNLKLRKALKEVPIEIKRFVSKSYPNFVLARHPKPLHDEVPVFMFHSVDADLFDRQLQFLHDNNYRTLTLTDFISFIHGKKQIVHPSVLLTFDDGHKSWFEIAYPKLMEYGFHAVGFLVPTFIEEHPGPGVWLSWLEVLEMENCGVMSFESHSTHHDRIFISPQLVDFYHPEYNDNLLEIDVPWISDGSKYTNHLSLGTPIYAHAPRLAGFRRYIDDENVRLACTNLVLEEGAQNFFRQSGWRKKLVNQYKKTVSRITSHKFETDLQQRDAIFDDLLKAKQLLSKKLDRQVQHLCYPWGVGSKVAVRLSQEAGYISNFWVVTHQRNINRPGNDPYFIPRLKDDYIMRLPGKGRQSLSELFLMKIRRRSMMTNIY
jgi:peptidoglycan/xylan/chitin deacetylase (PgdA/CDA1 family)